MLTKYLSTYELKKSIFYIWYPGMLKPCKIQDDLLILKEEARKFHSHDSKFDSHDPSIILYIAHSIPCNK
jgi:hypothetical protein